MVNSNKNTGTESLMSFPGRKHLTHVVTSHSGWIKRVLWLYQKTLKKPASGFPQTSHHTDFALYPLPVVTLSHEYNHVLSPVSPRRSPNLGEFLGTPGTEVYSQVLSSYLNCSLFTQFIFKFNVFSKSKNCLHSIKTTGLKTVDGGRKKR